ncbi:hypothetical protein T492DRAFT_910122 [Pavlovales sp. CCMP2436]|nr:hypothetical protein T492DRAFT_910122 [Pavlovales sp. CCMP2436]
MVLHSSAFAAIAAPRPKAPLVSPVHNPALPGEPAGGLCRQREPVQGADAVGRQWQQTLSAVSADKPLGFQQIAAAKADANALRASGQVPAVRSAFGPRGATPAASYAGTPAAAHAAPGASLHATLVSGGIFAGNVAPKFKSNTPNLRLELTGLDEHHLLKVRTQRSSAAEFESVGAGVGGSAMPAQLQRRRAHSSGRRSKAEARLFGEDNCSSLSADFIAMFAPSGTVVSTLDNDNGI